MKGYYSYAVFAGAGLLLLFVLDFCYVLLSLGVLVLGLITLPSSLFGLIGALIVTTDLTYTSLLLISAGLLLLGFGMCVGAAPVCASSYELLRRYLKTKALRREKSRVNADDKRQT